MSLLIPTHALPPLSYRVPPDFPVRAGSVVVAPLSGYSRFGVVVATGTDTGEAREDLRSAFEEISLPAETVETCVRVAEISAVPLATVLRAALPPGIGGGKYRVLYPAPRWTWRAGTLLSRAVARRELGRDGLLAAEKEGRLALVPALPALPATEWAVANPDSRPDLARARRQRELLEELAARGGACETATLLAATGASRGTLRELVRKGAVRLERRPGVPRVFEASGEHRRREGTSGVAKVVESGGAWLWRLPTAEGPAAAVAVARAAVEGGGRALILCPEIEAVERLAERLARALPGGARVAPYHGDLGRARGAVYEAARAGGVDVLVGTRAASLLPLPDLAAICVLDEPNDAHRAEPGYEGLPVHAREVVRERARVEGAGVLFVSPSPSLGLYDAVMRGEARELPARQPQRWPRVRIVDTRGAGTPLTSTFLSACRTVAQTEGRVGVVANRLGYATAVACSRCGAVRHCPECDAPLALHRRVELLVCVRCGRAEPADGRCPECGSDRLLPTGLAVERVRADLSAALRAPVGLLTAAKKESPDAPVVVGTAHCILEHRWDAVLFPDADALLTGGGIGASERAFRALYGAAESARRLLLIQTRRPEHYVLQAAARGDYPAFAAAELPRLRRLGYPPYAHLASIAFEGPEEAVRRAVESRLRPSLEAGVGLSEPVPDPRPGRRAWRVLVRSAERPAVARVGAMAARLAAQTRGLRARVEMDPEEV